ncbi:hypothetical protein Tco_1195822 [Tanacetum coccineum]
MVEVAGSLKEDFGEKIEVDTAKVEENVPLSVTRNHFTSYSWYTIQVENKREDKKDLLVPSCFVIFDLEPLSFSFDFVFNSEISKSFPCLS